MEKVKAISINSLSIRIVRFLIYFDLSLGIILLTMTLFIKGCNKSF